MPTIKKKAVRKMSAKKKPTKDIVEIPIRNTVLRLKPLKDRRTRKQILNDHAKAKKIHRQIVLTRGNAHLTWRSNKRRIK